MSLSPKQVRGLANTMGMDGAKQVAQAVADSGTAGVVNSSAGALQLGTNSTDIITVTGLLAESTSATLTAFAGGGQTSATLLTGSVNKVGTVANPGDSVKLQPSTPGISQIVYNGSSNTLQVFGSGTDTINGVTTTLGVPQAPWTISTYTVTEAGKWHVSDAELFPVITAISTVGAGTLTGAALIGGVINRTGSTAAYSDATDSAANIIAAVPGVAALQSYYAFVQNNTNFAETITAGANVTLAGLTVVPPQSVGLFLIQVTALTTVTITGLGTVSQMSGAQFATGTTTTTFTAGQLTPPNPAVPIVVYTNTGATPGSIATRTGALMWGDISNPKVGMSWLLRVVNGQATGTLTVAAAASGVTVTGTNTVAANTWRDFIVTATAANTFTFQNAGVGTFS